MNDFFTQWANENPENARLLTQELLITEVTEAIYKAMEEAGVNKSELADRMSATKGYITQVLSGSRNMTLRTLADFCFALGVRPAFNFTAAAVQDTWQQMTETVDLAHRELRYTRTDNLITPVDHWGKAA